MEIIQLKSRDGKLISVNRSILSRSVVLQRKLEELNAAADNGNTLDVPEADGECLRKIIQWMERPAGTSEGIENGSVELMIPNNQEQNLVPSAGNTLESDGFDKEMFGSFPQLCVLMAAANRLQLQDLKDAAVRFVVEWKQGKNLEDLREMMENGASHVRGPQQSGGGSGMQH
ncbi:uncharacterized protein LOC128709407 [Anopheles marshallii]|uniref:uncharacterized protein LOC128709407 n=1 Tax=Anopheles marshallii TaxID=1521116 RepID=UPI00237AA6D0|nr:uncharacterized protein LOC128709407 [Anopheles marshallii]